MIFSELSSSIQMNFSHNGKSGDVDYNGDLEEAPILDASKHAERQEQAKQLLCYLMI